MESVKPRLEEEAPRGGDKERLDKVCHWGGPVMQDLVTLGVCKQSREPRGLCLKQLQRQNPLGASTLQRFDACTFHPTFPHHKPEWEAFNLAGTAITT